MDVYIYTDGELINGDDADIRLKLPRSEGSILCDDNEQLETIDNEGNERLNILVEEGFDGTNFSRKILSEIRSVIFKRVRITGKTLCRERHDGTRFTSVIDGKTVDDPFTILHVEDVETGEKYDFNIRHLTQNVFF